LESEGDVNIKELGMKYEIRKQIASMYWDLKNDFNDMELQDIYYDVGLMVGLCICLNKPKLSDKIYSEFMGSK
tara:strand:+ start:25 stop:243 length:219 start_codon:yes stop_codon:yes gene_type:complete